MAALVAAGLGSYIFLAALPDKAPSPAPGLHLSPESTDDAGMTLPDMEITRKLLEWAGRLIQSGL